MTNEPKVVLLQYDLKSFYDSSLVLEVLKSIRSLDRKRLTQLI
jgi:hypothetical protein